MGCNCKKNRNQPTPEPIPLPEEIVELTDEEIDHFNNIDIIEPIEDGE
jgi:hypothetical protein